MNRIIVKCGLKRNVTAFIKDGELIELFVHDMEKAAEERNIYIGIVERIVDKRFAYINIGKDKNGFIDLKDPKEKKLINGSHVLLKGGSRILVQVTKEVSGNKGLCLTSEAKLYGKNLIIYKDLSEKKSYSRKLEKDSIKAKKILESFKGKGFGIIFRSNCANVVAEEVCAEFEKLTEVINSVYEQAENMNVVAPCKVYEPPFKVLQELSCETVDEIIVDDEAILKKLSEEARGIFGKNLKFNFYSGNDDIFDEFSITGQIHNALKTRLWLKNGANIVFQQTEGFFAIDINSGKFEKKGDDFAFKVNILAAEVIIKHLRLRNMSGIVVIDFLNTNAKERQELFDFLKAKATEDRLTVDVVDISKLCIVQLTRKKEREYLGNYLFNGKFY